MSYMLATLRAYITAADISKLSSNAYYTELMLHIEWMRDLHGIVQRDGSNKQTKNGSICKQHLHLHAASAAIWLACERSVTVV